jgi:hypothetical protein
MIYARSGSMRTVHDACFIGRHSLSRSLRSKHVLQHKLYKLLHAAV